MKLLFDVPPDLLERVNAAVAAEKTSLSQFVQLALQNQLEFEAAPSGPLKVENHRRPPLVNAAPMPVPAQHPDLETSRIAWDSITPASARATRDQPLWGQYNRLLPAKIGGRVLANLLATKPNGVPLGEFHQIANNVAVRVREELETVDRAQDLPRGERRAAAFPMDNDLSRRRFAEQFLGYVQANGQVTGLLPELGLTTIDADKDNTVRLTTEGIQFLRLPNPILDGGPHTSDALSADETKFLLSHLRDHVRPEYEFLAQLLQWIADGAATPDELFQQVLKKWPEWGDKKGQTMRNGAMGRLHDLGLLGRERNGLRVTYLVKPQGQSLVASTA